MPCAPAGPCRWTLEKAGPAFIKVGVAGRQMLVLWLLPRGRRLWVWLCLMPAAAVLQLYLSHPCRLASHTLPCLSMCLMHAGNGQAGCSPQYQSSHLFLMCSGASGQPRGTTSSRQTSVLNWSSSTRRQAALAWLDMPSPACSLPLLHGIPLAAVPHASRPADLV